jgi:tetratricopeptide (TPR) repeat protein
LQRCTDGTRQLNSVQAALPNSKVPGVYHCSLGVYYAMTVDIESAVQNIAKSSELEPDHAGAYNNRAVIKAHLGEGEAALEDIEYAVSLPEIPQYVLGTSGQVYYTLSRYEEALGGLDNAIEMGDTDAGACYFRTLTCERFATTSKVGGRSRESQETEVRGSSIRQVFGDALRSIDLRKRGL